MEAGKKNCILAVDAIWVEIQEFNHYSQYTGMSGNPSMRSIGSKSVHPVTCSHSETLSEALADWGAVVLAHSQSNIISKASCIGSLHLVKDDHLVTFLEALEDRGTVSSQLSTLGKYLWDSWKPADCVQWPAVIQKPSMRILEKEKLCV